jgi:hypothetical protein
MSSAKTKFKIMRERQQYHGRKSNWFQRSRVAHQIISFTWYFDIHKTPLHHMNLQWFLKITLLNCNNFFDTPCISGRKNSEFYVIISKIRYYKDVTLCENYVRDFFIAAILPVSVKFHAINL